VQDVYEIPVPHVVETMIVLEANSGIDFFALELGSLVWHPLFHTARKVRAMPFVAYRPARRWLFLLGPLSKPLTTRSVDERFGCDGPSGLDLFPAKDSS